MYPGFSWDRVVFLVAGIVLCFEFGMRRMFTTLMFSVVAK